MSNPAKSSEDFIPNWLGDSSEMAKRIRSFDWSTTPLGSLEAFPQSLRSALSILLPSKAHMAIFWGTDLLKFYNDAYVTLIGAKHPLILGQPARKAWNEIWDVLERLLVGVMETGEGVAAEDQLFVINRHGYTEEAYFDIFYDPIRDESGEVGGVFCIVKEMTQRVVGNRRLQTLRDLSIQTVTAKTENAACHAATEVLSSNAADLPFSLLYRLNTDGKAQLINATGVQPTLECSPESMDLTHTMPPLQAAIASVMKTGKPEAIHDLPVQFSADLPDCRLGEIVAKPQTAIVLPLSRSDEQRPSGFLVAGVSPFLALDRAYQDFLALVAASITTVITNASAYEEERQRAAALAKLDHAKTLFFSNISHEFRTPLTLMLSPLEQTVTQLRDILPAQARSQLELVQRNGKRLLKLVNTLLDFSRIEAGRTQVRYEPTNLATYTIELASLFQSVVKQAGLQLQVSCPPLPELIYIDQEMWEKIVSNLLSNAFKFTFEGEIEIALHSMGHQVELTVRDTGTGIPAAEIPKLFERFHRVEGARGRTFEGTGIGLSLVQELVQLQGGTISVESTMGQGSTFRVRLPMGTTHLANPLTNLGASSAIASGAEPYVQEALEWVSQEHSEDNETLNSSNDRDAQSSGLARILVVDDNSEMRNYLSRILSQSYKVEAVADGEAALAAAYDRTPDLVLTDVMMPGMNGFELLKQLRSNTQTRDLPILLLSARAGEESAVEGLEAGANDYLVKPFSARELLARVVTNLELGRSRQAAARRRLDAVVSSVSDFIYTFDLEGRFTYINQPLLDLWQKSYPEALGKTFFELNYPVELAAQLQHQIQQVITTRQPLKDEIPYTSAFGTRAYEYIFVPLLDADGVVYGVAGTTRDITDRKQVEEALQQSEERARLAIGIAQLGTWRYNLNTNFIELDERMCAIWGKSQDMTTISLSQVIEQIHPEDQARVELAVGAALNPRSNGTYEIEYRIVRDDGRERWIFANGQAQFAGEGASRQAIQFIGTALDITERKQVEAALHESEERLRTLTATIPQLIWSATPDGNVDYLSEQWADYIGLPLERLDDWNWQQVIHSEDLPNSLRDWERSLQSSEPLEIQHRFRYHTGEWRWHLVRGTPIKDEMGQITRWVGTCTDIQSEVDTKTALQASYEAEQQARALAEVAREEAQAANRVKDEFLAVLSHELRSPLNPILGWARLLQSNKLNPVRQIEALKTIERNAELQAQLIEDLLDISRIMQGKLSFTAAPVHLTLVIPAALETVRLAAEAKNIQILLDLTPDLAPVSGDAGRLQQVVWNLLTNAVKFTPQGGRVTVELRQLEGLAQIRVVDAGKGINSQFLPYVFEYFRQEDGSTTRKFGGLGLGLAIVRQLVELHGGTVFVESAGENQGATFTVRLPLLKQSIESADYSEAASVPDNALLLDGLKVLVVDDEPDSRDFVAFVLEQAGADVVALSSASEVLQSISHIQPDLLISDIGMPEMDGYMLIEQIRTQLPAPYGQICAIALTAYAGEANERQVLNAGFQRHLAKPIDPTELVTIASRLLRG
jgi:PAS domain S-box-containing protein